MTDYKYFDVRPQEGAGVVRLLDPASLDYVMMTDLRDELVGFFHQHAPGNLIVDFNGVTLCSSVVIAALIDTRNQVLEAGGQFKLCGMHENVRDVFRATQLDETVFDVHDTIADALAAL